MKVDSPETIEKLVNDAKEQNPEIGTIRITELTLQLHEGTDVHFKPYRIPLGLYDKTKEEVERLKEAGIIKPSTSSIASPAFVIPKRTGEVRLVIDYRRLNKQVIKGNYPLPTLNNVLTDLKDAEIFSQIDLNSGFHQILVKEADVHKTSFVVPFGQFEYLRMPFGLSEGPRVFQRAMNDLFHGFKGVACYMDDILLFTKNEEKHKELLKSVFEYLKSNGI